MYWSRCVVCALLIFAAIGGRHRPSFFLALNDCKSMIAMLGCLSSLFFGLSLLKKAVSSYKNVTSYLALIVDMYGEPVREIMRKYPQRASGEEMIKDSINNRHNPPFELATSFCFFEKCLELFLFCIAKVALGYRFNVISLK